jgi:Region found in RelA / SpoT proteins
MPDAELQFSVSQVKRAEHTLREPYDYITTPNPKTGYRGVHLVFKYKSDNPAFNGRLVEVQIRTREQHAWATAVETVGFVQGDSIKSGHGNQQWQRFFALMSSAIAYRESSPLVPSTPSDARELERELRRSQKLLQVATRLQLYSGIARIVEPPSAITVSDVQDADRVWFFLLELDVASGETSLTPYSEGDIRKAYQHMTEAENAGKNVVLAGAHSFEQLREAYPNWFIDTHNFLIILKAILGEDITLY